ncbi:unnamed protein product, partial [Ectocarpus fasciculatus]
ALLFLIDPQSAQASPGPRSTLGGAQLHPRWPDSDTLLFVELPDPAGPSGQPAALMRWTVGDPLATPVAPLNLPVSIFDAVHLDAGIPQLVSPDRRSLAYYAPKFDRIEIVDLDTGHAHPLQSGDRAGGWWNDGWFLVANDQQLQLVDLNHLAPGNVDEPPEATDETDPPRMTLLPGRWAPRWSDAVQGSMLLVGQSESPDRFAVLQVWAVTR